MYSQLYTTSKIFFISRFYAWFLEHQNNNLKLKEYLFTLLEYFGMHAYVS